MNEVAYLLVDILSEDGQHMNVRSYLEDDSPFELSVYGHDVRKLPAPNNPKIHPNRGYLKVEYSGESHKRASITLPSPATRVGQRITVSTSRIVRTLPKVQEKKPIEELYCLVDVVPETDMSIPSEITIVHEMPSEIMLVQDDIVVATEVPLITATPIDSE